MRAMPSFQFDSSLEPGTYRPSFLNGVAARWRSTNFHVLPFAEQVIGARDKRVRALDSAQYLHLVAHVLANGDRCKVERLVSCNGDDVHAAMVDDERTGRDDERAVLPGERKR